MRSLSVILSIVLGLASSLPPPAAAERAREREHDHDRAQDALARGEILPLHIVLPEIERRFGARLLEVELEPEHGRLVYEIKLITPGGRISEVVVDAATGAVRGYDHEAAEDED